LRYKGQNKHRGLTRRAYLLDTGFDPPLLHKINKKGMKFKFNKKGIYSGRWFFPKRCFSGFKVAESFYFDPRPTISTNIVFLAMLVGWSLMAWFGAAWWAYVLLMPGLVWGWGEVYLHLPLDSGIDDSEWRDWGFGWYSDDSEWIPESFMWAKGSRTRFIALPWSLNWYRTSYLMMGRKWFDEVLKTTDETFSDEFKSNRWRIEVPYRYVLKDGTVQDVTATVMVSESEWRRLFFFPRMKWWRLVRRMIDVEFSAEVVEGVGDWKGGTTRCSYELLHGESELDCLRRMERERKFKR